MSCNLYKISELTHDFMMLQAFRVRQNNLLIIAVHVQYSAPRHGS